MQEGRRIEGYDFARALAILGMIVVHFCLVMSFDRKEPAFLWWIVKALDGRPAALFLILAGIGISLRAASARTKADAAERGGGSGDPLAAVRRTLCLRGLVLLAAGFVNLLIWRGDILRVYGISLFVAALLCGAADRRLLASAGLFIVAFLVLFAVSDYDVEWDWATYSYRGLWTLRGGLRNLFYNGFRSVFPWTGLLLFGMWLGRRNLDDPAVRKRFFLRALAAAAVAESASTLLVRYLDSHPSGLGHDVNVALFGTESIPPLPLFLLAAGSSAVAVIAASLPVAERFGSAFPVRAVVACGQMAFTWYVLHIVVGLGTILSLDLTDEPLWLAFSAALICFAAAALISLVVRSRRRRGPLEWLLRKVAG
jgi:uncharacterized membrane protein YeiB